jgi:hypothetical protein
MFAETRVSRLSEPMVIKSSLRKRLRITLRRRPKDGRGERIQDALAVRGSAGVDGAG